MRLVFSGWARDHGEHIALSKTINASSVGDKNEPLSSGSIRLSSFDYMTFENGKATLQDIISWGEQSVTSGVEVESSANLALNGDYYVKAQFTADELLLMTVEATKDWPVSYLLKKLSRLKEGKEA